MDIENLLLFWNTWNNKVEKRETFVFEKICMYWFNYKYLWEKERKRKYQKFYKCHLKKIKKYEETITGTMARDL